MRRRRDGWIRICPKKGARVSAWRLRQLIKNIYMTDTYLYNGNVYAYWEVDPALLGFVVGKKGAHLAQVKKLCPGLVEIEAAQNGKVTLLGSPLPLILTLILTLMGR